MKAVRLKLKVAKENWYLYVMLAPLIVWLILFAYRPMVGLVMAFQNFSPFRGIEGSPWVGLDNFRNLIMGTGSHLFWRAVRNTVIISAYQILFAFPAPIILALMFNELKNGFFKNMSQTILFIPNFLSDVIVAGIIIAFLQPESGVINHILINAGIIDQGIYFLTRPEYFRTIFVVTGIWQSAGFSSLIYFAALTGISESLYEAAKLDGATRIQRIMHISIPGILPTIIVMFIMQIGQVLNVGFERILLLYQPATFETADVLGTYVYRLGLINSDFSQAAAVGLLNSVVSLILVVTANTISKKLSETALW